MIIHQYLHEKWNQVGKKHYHLNKEEPFGIMEQSIYDLLNNWTIFNIVLVLLIYLIHFSGELIQIEIILYGFSIEKLAALDF